MKVLPEISAADYEQPPKNKIFLPQGIVGFAGYKSAELLYLPDHLPFLWMKLNGPETLQFIVIEPGGNIPNYSPEIFDEDAHQLDIRDASEAMVLNIVTLLRQVPVEATVNLIGPIIINRRTCIGRQLVISNYSRYSAHHSLVENPPAEACERSA
jgi:flagellar assembly factor FliW